MTVHKYINKELKLYSISRRKKPNYKHGTAHRDFDNKLNQNFVASEINRKWCTDFIYLYLTDGSAKDNCTIIDLHGKSVIASITDHQITADLAIRTLQKAIDSQEGIDLTRLMFHSDQGNQYTSKEFTDFCKTKGCP